MIRVFADTSFYVALLNPRDQYHEKACDWTERDIVKITTEFVLVELGNSFCRQESRPGALSSLNKNFAPT